MEHTQTDITQPQQQPEVQEPYVPRPSWQVWCARLGLVIFLIFVVLQLIQIARGGM